MMVKARARVEVGVGETVRVTVRAWQQGHLGVLVRVGFGLGLGWVRVLDEALHRHAMLLEQKVRA